jgi:hypothetical protein
MGEVGDRLNVGRNRFQAGTIGQRSGRRRAALSGNVPDDRSGWPLEVVSVILTRTRRDARESRALNAWELAAPAPRRWREADSLWPSSARSDSIPWHSADSISA